MVSRKGTCVLEGVSVLGRGGPFIHEVGKAIMAWLAVLAGSWVILLLAGQGPHRSWASMSWAGCVFFGLLAVVAPVLWELEALPWMAVLLPASALVAFCGGEIRMPAPGRWGGLVRWLVIALSMVLLDLGLSSLPQLEKLRIAASLSPADYLTYDVPIGSRRWRYFAGIHEYRGRRFEPRPNEVARVLCLGGSSTWGAGVESAADSYPAQLEKELEPLYKAQVVNAGMPGFTSNQVRVQVELEVPALKPDVVVVSLGYNDCNRLLQPGTHYYGPSLERKESVPARVLRWMRVSSLWLVARDAALSTYRWVTGLLEGLFYEEGVPLQVFKDNIAHIVDLSRESGAGVVLVKEPRAARWRRYDRCSGYDEVMETFKGMDGVLVLDPVMEWGVERSLDLFVDGVHMNRRGYRMLARQVAGACTSLLSVRSNSSCKEF